VMLVAKLNRLLSRKKSLSVVRGPIELKKQPDNYGDKEDRAEDADFGNEVRASMKNLAHRLLSSERRLEKLL